MPNESPKPFAEILLGKKKSDIGKFKKKRDQVGRACFTCRHAKKRCNGSLPCSRCAALRVGSSCLYSQLEQQPSGLFQLRLSREQGHSIVAARVGLASLVPLSGMGWRTTDLLLWWENLPPLIRQQINRAFLTYEFREATHGFENTPFDVDDEHFLAAAQSLRVLCRWSSESRASVEVDSAESEWPQCDAGVLEVHYDAGLPRTVLANESLAKLFGLNISDLLSRIVRQDLPLAVPSLDFAALVLAGLLPPGDTTPSRIRVIRPASATGPARLMEAEVRVVRRGSPADRISSVKYIWKPDTPLDTCSESTPTSLHFLPIPSQLPNPPVEHLGAAYAGFIGQGHINCSIAGPAASSRFAVASKIFQDETTPARGRGGASDINPQAAEVPVRARMGACKLNDIEGKSWISELKGQRVGFGNQQQFLPMQPSSTTAETTRWSMEVVDCRGGESLDRLLTLVSDLCLLSRPARHPCQSLLLPQPTSLLRPQRAAQTGWFVTEPTKTLQTVQTSFVGDMLLPQLERQHFAPLLSHDFLTSVGAFAMKDRVVAFSFQPVGETNSEVSGISHQVLNKISIENPLIGTGSCFNHHSTSLDALATAAAAAAKAPTLDCQ